MVVPSLAKAKVSIVAEMGKLEKDLASLKTKIKVIGIVTGETEKKAGKAWRSFGNRIEGTANRLTGFKQKLVGLGAMYIGKKLAGDFIEVAASFEAMEVQLDVLTKGRGKQTLDELNQWALDMPVNTQKAVDSFRLMTAMGINPTIKTLETLTDVASIFGDDVLQRLALQLGQASAKGKIMAQDLNIMAEAGINARKYLKDAYGMTVEEIQRSGIDINEIIGTIFKGMEREFGGSAKKMMTSWRGLKTVTKSYFVEIERSIMAAGVFDELKESLSLFNDEMKAWLEGNRELIKQNVPIYIKDVKDSLKKLWDLVTGNPDVLEFGLIGLAIYGKKGLIIGSSLGFVQQYFDNMASALGLASTGYVSYAEAIDEAANVTARFNKEMSDSPAVRALKKDLEAVEKTIWDIHEARALGSISDINSLDTLMLKYQEINVISEKIKDLLSPEKSVELDENPWENERIAIEETLISAKKLKIQLDALRAPGREQSAHILEYYKQLEKTQEKYDTFMLNSMDKTSKEYKDLYLKVEKSKWAELVGLTDEQSKKIKKTIEKNLAVSIAGSISIDEEIAKWDIVKKEFDDATKNASDQGFILSDEVIKEFEKRLKTLSDKVVKALGIDLSKGIEGGIQTGLGGVLSDTLLGEFDTTEDHFKSLIDSMSNMWGQMVAKMAMTPAMQSAGGFASLGWIGLFVGAISSMMDDVSEQKERERVRAETIRNLNTQVESGLAELELTDFNYELFELNKRFDEMSKAAISAGASIEGLSKLRKLETAAILERSVAGYNNLAGTIQDFNTGKQRESWGVSDWQREFGNITDNLLSLDSTQDDYNDKSLELLTDQFEVLKNINSIQEDQLRSLDSTSQSLVSQAAGLRSADGMPLDIPFFEEEYQKFLDAALEINPETETLDQGSIAAFQNFISQYMDALSTNGADFAQLTEKASSDLLMINDSVQSEIERLTDAMVDNTGAVEGNTGIMNQLKSLEDTVTGIANEDTFSKWLQTAPIQIDEAIIERWENLNLDATKFGQQAKIFPDIISAVLGLETYSKDLLFFAENASGDTKNTAEWIAFNNWAKTFVTASEIGENALDSGDFSQSATALANMLSILNRIPEAPEFDEVYGNEPIYNTTIVRHGIGETPSSNSRAKETGEPQILQPIQLIVGDKVLSETIINLSRTDPEFKEMLANGVN